MYQVFGDFPYVSTQNFVSFSRSFHALMHLSNATALSLAPYCDHHSEVRNRAKQKTKKKKKGKDLTQEREKNTNPALLQAILQRGNLTLERRDLTLEFAAALLAVDELQQILLLELVVAEDAGRALVGVRWRSARHCSRKPRKPALRIGGR